MSPCDEKTIELGWGSMMRLLGRILFGLVLMIVVTGAAERMDEMVVVGSPAT
jgi:hypothetical protein